MIIYLRTQVAVGCSVRTNYR